MRVQSLTFASLSVALVVASSMFACSSARAWDPFRTANSNVESGNARMAAGDAAGALAAYDLAAREHPSEPRVALNRGLALLASGDMPAAREAFVQAADPDAPVEVRAAAYYDLGLAFYNEGDAAATEEDHETAQGHFREAADAFRRSLRVRPSDRDTAWNLELTLRRIREQEEAQQEQEEQEQQEQQEQDQQEQQEGDEQNEGDQEGDEQNQDQNEGQGDEQNQDQNEGQGDEQNQDQNEGQGDEQNQDQNEGQGDEQNQEQNGQEAGDNQENNGGDDTPDSRPDQGEEMEGGQRPSHVDRVLDALQDNEQSLERARAHARASREGRRVLRDW